MADPGSISIVIPAFNEGHAIADVVSVLRGAAQWREIIVVDDGSSDDTAARAEAAGASVVCLAYNMVIGARSKETQATQARRAGNGMLNRLAGYMTGREILDLTSGFRGART